MSTYYMLGTILSVFFMLTKSLLIWEVIVSPSTLQMRKQRPREVKRFLGGHIANQSRGESLPS